jgi:hypothetical protein
MDHTDKNQGKRETASELMNYPVLHAGQDFLHKTEEEIQGM